MCALNFPKLASVDPGRRICDVCLKPKAWDQMRFFLDFFIGSLRFCTPSSPEMRDRIYVSDIANGERSS